MLYKRPGSVILITLWILLIAYSALVNTLDPSGLGLVDDSSLPFWRGVGPVSALILLLLKPLWQATRSDGNLRHITVSDSDKTDMKQMAKYMKRADNVIIYSGDFSYIYSHEPLYETLLDLAERENLRFMSYKSERTVLSRSEAHRGSRECIIAKLLFTKNILFDLPYPAKFSLIYRGGEEVLLYRHRDTGADYVTVFKAGSGMSKKLVETIKTLVDTIISQRVAAG